tara:strand:- start:571 stop:996 length:426 start_codon:yes stop_codon:yes gene_type:complete
MKAQLFEKLIRKVVREEIDYALRRELKSLKEDLRDDINPLIKEQSVTNSPIPSKVKNSLKEKIMGKDPIKKQNFVKDNTLNTLLNETAMGNTDTQTAMAPISSPFSTSQSIPTEAMPDKIASVVNRDYRDLMKAIDTKKNK